MLSHRELIYVGDPIPEQTSKDNSAFLMLIQESILLSLKDRKLLNNSQYDRCIDELYELKMRRNQNNAKLFLLSVFLYKIKW